MNVTLKQLEAFVAVADTGSFTAAAQAIHVSQPALSSLIQNLEGQLGAQLFERDPRGVSITTTGRELLPSIRKALNELNETVAAVLHATSPRGGVVSMACIPSVAALFMPPLIAKFQALHPQVKIELRDAMVENQGIIDMLRTGLIDFGLASPIESAGLLFKFLFEDELVAIVSSGHRLACRGHISWSDLVGEQVIGLSKNSYIRQLTDDAFAKIGVSKHPYGPVSLITTAVGLAKHDLGVAVLPDSAAQVCNLDGVTLLGIREPTVSRPLGFLYRSMTSLSPAAKAFMSFVEKEVQH